MRFSRFFPFPVVTGLYFGSSVFRLTVTPTLEPEENAVCVLVGSSDLTDLPSVLIHTRLLAVDMFPPELVVQVSEAHLQRNDSDELELLKYPVLQGAYFSELKLLAHPSLLNIVEQMADFRVVTWGTYASVEMNFDEPQLLGLLRRYRMYPNLFSSHNYNEYMKELLSCHEHRSLKWERLKALGTCAPLDEVFNTVHASLERNWHFEQYCWTDFGTADLVFLSKIVGGLVHHKMRVDYINLVLDMTNGDQTAADLISLFTDDLFDKTVQERLGELEEFLLLSKHLLAQNYYADIISIKLDFLWAIWREMVVPTVEIGDFASLIVQAMTVEDEVHPEMGIATTIQDLFYMIGRENIPRHPILDSMRRMWPRSSLNHVYESFRNLRDSYIDDRMWEEEPFNGSPELFSAFLEETKAGIGQDFENNCWISTSTDIMQLVLSLPYHFHFGSRVPLPGIPSSGPIENADVWKAKQCPLVAGETQVVQPEELAFAMRLLDDWNHFYNSVNATSPSKRVRRD